MLDGYYLMNILVVQNSSLDPIGVLGEHLTQLGAQLHVWLAEEHPYPSKHPLGYEYDGLIILGGPMNAHEDEKFSHLADVVGLIHQFHAEHKPIMGICLCAQLIARAFGSQVYPHSEPELGFSPVYAVNHALATAPAEPWLKDFTQPLQPLQVMQWHFDTFDLPAEATLLMTNDACKYQAYRIGRNIYGFQFHFEVTPEIVMSWMAMKNDWIEANYPNLDAQIAAQVQQYGQQSAQFAQSVAQYWITLRP